MLTVVHAKKSDCVYVTHNRTGSSFLSEVATGTPGLSLIDNKQLISLAEKGKKIKFLYRDPIARKQSGLFITFHLPNVNKMSELTAYMYTLMHTYSQNTFNFVPYSIGDSHLCNVLILPLYLIACGYNVEMVPLNTLTDELRPLTDDVESYRNLLPKDNTFIACSTSTKVFSVRESWKHYVFLANKFHNNTISFDQWLEAENLIFRYFIKEEINQRTAQELITKLSRNYRYYFADLDSIIGSGLSNVYNIQKKYNSSLIDPIVAFEIEFFFKMSSDLQELWRQQICKEAVPKP